MDRTKIARDWHQKGFGCDLWTDPPGQVWKDYVHDVDELFMVLEGDVELEIKGERRRLKIGEEVLIPAGVTHSVFNVGRTTSQWLYGYKGGSV